MRISEEARNSITILLDKINKEEDGMQIANMSHAVVDLARLSGLFMGFESADRLKPNSNFTGNPNVKNKN